MPRWKKKPRTARQDRLPLRRAHPPPARPLVPPPQAARQVTWIQLSGPAADEDKQQRCNHTAAANGWRIHRLANVAATLWLSRDKNELTVFGDGKLLSRRTMSQDNMEYLCTQALTEISRVTPATAAPLLAVRSATETPATAPPREADFVAAVEPRRSLLKACRQAYAPEVRTLMLAVTLSPAGNVTSVEVVDLENTSQFANCVQRVARQVRLRPFSGGETRLRPSFQLDE